MGAVIVTGLAGTWQALAGAMGCVGRALL